MTIESLLDDSGTDNKDYLAELVGEGKKYANEKELAKAYAHADTYIKVMEKRVDDSRDMYLKLRDESAAQTQLEDLLKKFDNKQQQLASSDNTNDANEVNREPAIKPEAVKDLVSQGIREYEETKRAEENLKTVKAKLTERFGENYSSVVRDRIKELDLSDKDVDFLARKSPNALINALGLNETKVETFQTPPKSAVNFKPQGAPKRTLSYYQEMKKTNPKLYLDRNIAIQMDKDAHELGEAFFDV